MKIGINDSSQNSGIKAQILNSGIKKKNDIQLGGSNNNNQIKPIWWMVQDSNL